MEMLAGKENSQIDYHYRVAKDLPKCNLGAAALSPHRPSDTTRVLKAHHPIRLAGIAHVDTKEGRQSVLGLLNFVDVVGEVP